MANKQLTADMVSADGVKYRKGTVVSAEEYATLAPAQPVEVKADESAVSAEPVEEVKTAFVSKLRDGKDTVKAAAKDPLHAAEIKAEAHSEAKPVEAKAADVKAATVAKGDKG